MDLTTSLACHPACQRRLKASSASNNPEELRSPVIVETLIGLRECPMAPIQRVVLAAPMADRLA